MPRSSRSGGRRSSIGGGGSSRGGLFGGRPSSGPTTNRRPHSTMAVPPTGLNGRSSMGTANPGATSSGSRTTTTTTNQPGLFGQMASTAAGVAVGSTVGHVVGAGITGMFSGGNDTVDSTNTNGNVDTYSNMNDNYMVRDEPCANFKAQFTNCLQTNQDSLQCNEFWEMFRNCQENTKTTNW